MIVFLVGMAVVGAVLTAPMRVWVLRIAWTAATLVPVGVVIAATAYDAFTWTVVFSLPLVVGASVVAAVRSAFLRSRGDDRLPV